MAKKTKAEAGRMGALALHAKYDAKETTAEGRRVFLEKYSGEKRTEHFRGLAAKSAVVRRRQAEERRARAEAGKRVKAEYIQLVGKAMAEDVGHES